MIREVIKRLIKQISCKHEYEFLCDLSYREVSTDKVFHEISICCSKCGNKKRLKKFAKRNVQWNFKIKEFDYYDF